VSFWMTESLREIPVTAPAVATAKTALPRFRPISSRPKGLVTGADRWRHLAPNCQSNTTLPLLNILTA